MRAGCSGRGINRVLSLHGCPLRLVSPLWLSWGLPSQEGAGLQLGKTLSEAGMGSAGQAEESRMLGPHRAEDPGSAEQPW